MTDPKLDAEQLAALLDGRMDAASREAALRRLAESDDDARAAFADAAAIMGEMEGGEGATPASPGVPETPVTRGAPAAASASDATVLPFRDQPASPRWWSGRPLLVAAGLAGVLLVPWLVMRVGDGTPAPAAFVLQLPSGPVPESPWPTLRDAGPAPSLTSRGRAVRLGARLLDARLHVAARSPAVTGAAADVYRLLLADPPLTGAPSQLYRDAAAGAPIDAARIDASWDTIEDLAGREDVRYGAWLEAARVSALRRDAAFFARRDSRAMLERAELATVRSAVESSAPDWNGVERELHEVLRTAGR